MCNKHLKDFPKVQQTLGRLDLAPQPVRIEQVLPHAIATGTACMEAQSLKVTDLLAEGNICNRNLQDS